MANERSDILKLQDTNNDGYHDECPDIEFAEEKECPPCKPDPNALVEDWKKAVSGEAWFNGKYCTYQTTIVTKKTSLAPPEYANTMQWSEMPEDEKDELAAEYVEELWEEHQEDAIEGLLESFNKKDDETARNAIRESLVRTKYDLDPRPTSRVKLLYTIAHEVFAPLEDLEEDASDEPAPSDDGGETTVKYVASSIPTKLIKFSRAMHLYSRYYRVYNAVDGGVFVFIGKPKAGKVFTTGQFDSYGSGFNNGRQRATTIQFLNDLDNWLNSKKMNILGWGGFMGGANNPHVAVTDLEFTFDKKSKLTRMKVWTEGCAGKPREYNSKKSLKRLANRPAWRDGTMCAYFTQLSQIDDALNARQAQPWHEIIEQYTWPKVEAKFNYGQQSKKTDKAKKESTTALSCMGDALESEAKQLGQDILDEVFSIGDAIASAFNKNMCKDTWDGAMEEGVKLGYVWDPETKTQRPVGQMAKEKAFKQLYADEQVFTRLCAQMLDEGIRRAAGGLGSAMTPETKADGIQESLRTIKECGMFDLLVGALECLFKGFNLEDALKVMINKALEAMELESFGQLFYGLPPEKQQQVEALVYQQMGMKHPDGAVAYNTKQGQERIGDRTDQTLGTDGKPDIRPLGSALDEATGASKLLGIPSGQDVKLPRPWEDKSILESYAEDAMDGEPRQPTRRTLPECAPNAQTDYEAVDIPGGWESPRSDKPGMPKKNNETGELTIQGILGLDPGAIMRAYFTALVEVYQDNLLDLVDELNDFPGAPIIKGIIAAIDCPSPPIFDPSLMDFINSIDLPWCKNINDLALPMIKNPFGWISSLWDLVKLLFEILKMVIMQILMEIITKILVKICQLIGDAICKALETVGAVAAALPSMIRGETSLTDVINESICGGTADEQKVADTVTDMMEKLGAGGAALADQEGVMGFMGDLSSGITTAELNDALLGNAPDAFLDVAENLLENEYNQFRDGLPNKVAVADFFKNVGNLFPADVKSAMQDAVNQGPDDMPANPSLCASPEALEDFQNLRCELLSNRATATQCKEMFDNFQNERLDDLGDLANALQKGMPQVFADAMPPLVSTPGCDDGLIPFESEGAQEVAGQALGGDLKKIKIAYSKDMIGEGGIRTGFSDASWGMVNMALADTSGLPLSQHKRAVVRSKRVVDFSENQAAPTDLIEYFLNDPAPTQLQYGAYPVYVAEWLREKMSEMEIEYKSNNAGTPAKIIYRSMEQLGFGGGGWFSKPVNLLKMPEFGYNTSFSISGDDDIKITKHARKGSPDITLKFTNNNRGKVQHDGYQWGYGFDVKVYNADIKSGTDSSTGTGYYNVFSDNTRIKIIERFNPLAHIGIESDESLVRTKFEFASVDETLDNTDVSSYPNFLDAFTPNAMSGFSPQVVLIQDMARAGNEGTIPGPLFPSLPAIQKVFDAVSTNAYTQIINEVVDNEAVWRYGATYDDLTEDDLEYVVKPGSTDSPGGTPYYKAKVNGDSISEDDGIMGYSRMQYEEEENDSGRPNRVFFLDPTESGGNYVFPAIYIKPVKNTGWLGMIDILFPEVSPCKPSLNDLVDFGSIEDEVQESYNKIPMDERLKDGLGCADVVPYNRILTRVGAAGIQGIITAACRMFASAHFFKSMPTFMTFKPDFSTNYSSIYATYVIENMERAFKHATPDILELLAAKPFSDQEFWYAFLEQSVQTYGRLVNEGKVEPPEHVLCAMRKINDIQEGFYYRDAHDLWQDKWYQDEPLTQTLVNYRTKHNLQAVQRTEEYAKIVLKEMVMQQLEHIGELFLKNAKSVNMEPRYNSVEYFVMEKMFHGGETLTLQGNIEPIATALPTEGDNHFTNGGELSTQPDGEDYIGPYHVHIDEDGNTTYMEGPEHVPAEHSELTVYAQSKTTPIGDVADYQTTNISLVQDSKPFFIEKYIKIDDTKYSAAEGYNVIQKAARGSATIHDVYPGTLELITETATNEVTGLEEEVPVGLEGEMGVRYGLELSMVVEGRRYRLVSQEIDALDVPIPDFKPLAANSTQLLCLINLLRDSEQFRLITRYFMGAAKATSVCAIYNDFGFFPSIGELTVAEGDRGSGNLQDKPGVGVYTDDDGQVTDTVETPGWEYGGDRRSPFWWIGTLEFDDWDKVIMRNSTKALKRVFKSYYRLRPKDTKASDIGKAGDASKLYLRNLKAAYFRPAGAKLVPWWQKPMLRSNPFDKNGKLCPK